VDRAALDRHWRRCFSDNSFFLRWRPEEFVAGSNSVHEPSARTSSYSVANSHSKPDSDTNADSYPGSSSDADTNTTSDTNSNTNTASQSGDLQLCPFGACIRGPAS
jgi:hypothetical protein